VSTIEEILGRKRESPTLLGHLKELMETVPVSETMFSSI
jgi:hypothetical protein